jgi:hypothetical protein
VIGVFFNETGYYVSGEGIEVSRSCSPALTEHGDPIFQSLQHMYKVLFLALRELHEIDIGDDVMVYGDNRIIDEVNGTIEPLDNMNQKWLNVLHRYTIPSIRSLVFFRRKPASHVRQSILAGHASMLTQIDSQTIKDMTRKEEEHRVRQHKQRGKRIVTNLRNSWFGDKDNAQ